jgi:hypothetical protein
LRASRTLCCRTVSPVSSPPTPTTRARLASLSTSSPRLAWVYSQKACANGSRTPRQSPSPSPSQKATATTHAASPATPHTPPAATRAPAVEAGLDHAHPHGAAKTPARDLAPRLEAEATLAALHQTGSASLARVAQGRTQTRDRALALRRHANAITLLPARPHGLDRRPPSAAVVVRQIRCLGAHRRRRGVGVLLRV